MISKFFIDRPVFANVIAIITMIVGGVALWRLPIEQYPEITPPTVRVSTNYPGANATVVADTVAAPIEQQVNGVENMLYMSSTCSSDGSYSLTITFEIGTNLDMAQVLVQNRIAIAEPLLPEEVRRQGLTVKKQSTNMVLVVTLTSENNKYDALFLSNFANLRLRDEVSRVAGVGDMVIFGGNNYSMRVWLNPEQLKARNLTSQDVIAAIQEQNVQVAAGQIGQQPAPQGLNLQLILSAQGRLSEAKQFENIVVRTAQQGRLTYLRDVATVELGAQSYDQFSQMNGQPAASLAVFQLPGANSLTVATEVRALVDRIAPTFPEGLKYNYPLDRTLFVRAAIREVYRTLIEAGVLVLIVIVAFLQSWRAALVPATTVPVTIIGAFTAMYVMGFSVNLLTLFGLVLAIGIVVDDAIVIVEAAAHNVERGMPAREATIRAMELVLGPIISITLVLMSVFIPAAFLGGITGELYRQFALTIAATALISAINAITLKPAQCAVWLRPPPERPNLFFRGFNWVYSRIERTYVGILRQVLRHAGTAMLVFVAITALAGWWYYQTPTGFLPNEDQGYFVCPVQLPDAASLERTREVIEKINRIFAEMDGVSAWFAVGGFSFLDQAAASNMATCFVRLTAWDDRADPSLSIGAIIGKANAELSQIQEARVFAFQPPPIQGLGVGSGFKMQIVDRQGTGLSDLYDTVQRILEAARSQTILNPVTLNSTFRAGVPQLFVDVDREKVKTLDIALGSVFNTLQANLGSAYVNDFNKFGRTFQVRTQAQGQFRKEPRDIGRLEVRNRTGAMVPLNAVAEIKRSFGPQVLNRYNLYPAGSVTGEPVRGVSSNEALRVMEEIASRELPASMGYEWTDISFQEKRVGNEAIWIFAFAVLLVYLVLAAQYESWVLPFAVILVVPLGLLGAIAATTIRGMDNNVYTQIGIVLIIALASKNAILIVEYARELHADGKSIFDAALMASQIRFRPIIMTSFAFILGVLPLVFASGAGAAGQKALGTAVFGGMIASTLLAVIFVPVFFFVLQHLRDWLRPAHHDRPLGHVPM